MQWCKRVRWLATALAAAVAFATVAVAVPAQAASNQRAGPVTGVAALPGDNPGEIVVTWDAHPKGHKDHRVAYKPIDGTFQPHSDKAWNVFPTDNTVTLTGLVPGAEYRVRVRARFADGTNSQWPSPVTGTAAEAPATVEAASGERAGPVTGVAAQPGDNPGEIVVTWDAHPKGHKDHRVAYKPIDGTFQPQSDKAWNVFPTDNTVTLTGLVPGAEYRVRVRARFADGTNSQWPSPVTGTAAEEAEAPPENSAPDDGTSSTLLRSDDDNTNDDSGDRAPRDSDGPTLNAPGTPLNLSVVPSDSKLTVTWDPPSNTDEYDVSSLTYSVRYQRFFYLHGRICCHGDWTTIATDLAGESVTIRNLNNGSHYEVEVTAKTLDGASEVVTDTGSPSGYAPGAPSIDSVTPGYDTLWVTWNQPANLGGYYFSDIIYTVQYRVHGTNEWTTFADNVKISSFYELTSTITRLANNVQYDVRVGARTPAGTAGPFSVQSGARTTGAAPGSPREVKVIAGNTWLRVVWQPPSDTGGSLHSQLTYKVEYRAGNTGDWTTLTPLNVSGAAYQDPTGAVVRFKTVTIPGLTNGTAYQVRIAAISASGATGSHNTVSGTPLTTEPLCLPVGSVRADEITVGGDPKGGFVNTLNDGVWYPTRTFMSIALVANTTYKIDITPSPSFYSSVSPRNVWGVYDPAGKLVPGTFNSGGRGTTFELEGRVVFTALTEGTYCVGVTTSSDRGGAYGMKAKVSAAPSEDLPTGTNGTLTVGGSAVTVTMDYLRDIDTFDVDLAAGKTYKFSVTNVLGSSGFSSAAVIVSVLDPDGNLVERAVGGYRQPILSRDSAVIKVPAGCASPCTYQVSVGEVWKYHANFTLEAIDITP